MMASLTACILTLNEAKHVGACIEALRWADEILVFDSFSSDETIALATAAGATVQQHPFANYSQQRNAALAVMQTDWVLFVDADERATPAMAAEVRDMIANRPGTRLVCPAPQLYLWQAHPRRRLVSRLSGPALPGWLCSLREGSP